MMPPMATSLHWYYCILDGLNHLICISSQGCAAVPQKAWSSSKTDGPGSLSVIVRYYWITLMHRLQEQW